MKTVELLGYCGKCGYSVDSDFCYRCQRLVENKIMTKKQIHSEINSKFYSWVNKIFPAYDLDFNEGYGRVYLTNSNPNDTLEYHQSQHYITAYYINDYTKKAVTEMDKFLGKLKQQYEL